MSYIREPFEELDIMNFFMFNQLVTNPETKDKFCHLLIKSLLGRDVDQINILAESVIFPTNPDKRGVRLDVKIEEITESKSIANIYDIEPHRDIEKYYPRKNRYYQSQIDKDSMNSGDDDYSHMPNLYIICITNYDPFGYGQMLYTIRNECVEVPELVYNDGVCIMYFNTVGHKGGSKALKTFLNFLENTTDSNVIDEATKNALDCVEVIRSNYRTGGNYMTLGNLMDYYAREAVVEATGELNAILAEKDSTIAEKDSTIAKLQEELAILKAAQN